MLHKKKITLGSVIFLMYGVFILFQFLYIGYNSLRPRSDILSNILGKPSGFSLDAYAYIFVNDHFETYIFSSLIILVGSLLLNTVLASMVAYGIGRYEFRGRRAVLSYFLVGLMFPIQLSIVPLFLLMRDAGLINSYLSVILICGIAISMPVLMLNNFFREIPNEIYESAKLEGASEFRIFAQIMFPLATPVIFSMMIISSLSVWNQFLLPMIFLQSDSMKTIPLALLRYRVNLISIDRWLAATVTAAFPVLILYFIFSKRIISGVTEGGVKG